MPTDQPLHEEDTVLSNFRLIATWWNLFVFAINPALSWAWLFYVVLHIVRKGRLDAILSPYAQFYLGLAYILAAVFLACHTRQKIIADFEQAGYVQQPTTRRGIDLFLNLAVIVACWYGVQNWCNDAEDSDFRMYAYIVFSGLMLWGGIFLALLGPTLWFSVRTR